MTTLFFRNLFRSHDGKEDNHWFHQSTLYLASSLSLKGKGIAICKSRFSTANNGILDDMDELLGLLSNRQIRLVAISLLEPCFDQTLRLAEFIKEKSNALIILGGIMPTHNPMHVASHFPHADIIVRGDGEQVLAAIVEIAEKEGLSRKILSQKGVMVKLDGIWEKSADFCINEADMSGCQLDYGLLGKENVVDGINLSSSRGCRNGCLFCTSPFKGRFRGMPAQKLAETIEDYSRRLTEIFGEDIPPRARRISFNDDDFTADRERAIAFFRYMKGSTFKINFIQVSINSLLKDGRPDLELIHAMDPAIFESDMYSVYIGTENFCDRELSRLGKGNDFNKICSVIEALAERGIIQAHHVILSNTYTELPDLLENLVRIAGLKARHGPFFNVLRPMIRNLVSFFPTASYKRLEKDSQQKSLRVTKWLVSSDESLTYPLVEKDESLDPDVREIISMADRIWTSDDWMNPIEKVMIHLIRQLERTDDMDRKARIQGALDRFCDYPCLVEEISGRKADGDKNNIQVMITRRCPLRCTYCPIPKKDSDMEWPTLKAAIDLLFRSKKDELRLDFTGGEPLLKFPLMRKGMEYALCLAHNANKRISFYIVTNALLLTDEVAQFLTGKDVMLELSIDGPEAMHNRYKIPINKGINPYRMSIENISHLKGKDISRYAVIVAAPESASALADSFEHLIELGFDNIDINYAIGSLWTPEAMRDFFSQTDIILERHEDDIRAGRIRLGNMGKRAEPAVLNTEFMIDTDGKIRYLNEFLFRTKTKRKSPYELGDVYIRKSLDEIKTTKSMVYYSLHKMFGHEAGHIIRNNIDMGILAGRYFRMKRKQ
jgi:sulfatase maturation enzyme AslB (radical SAM superfamily)